MSMSVNVVSLNGKIFSGEAVKEASVPTIDGQIGVLPGHVSLITALGLGLLRIYLEGGAEEEIVINNGLLVVSNDEVNILAETAEMTDSLVKEQIDNAIHDAEEKLATTLQPNELIELEKQLRYERFKKELHDQ